MHTRASQAIRDWLSGASHPDDAGPRTQGELARRCSAQLAGDPPRRVNQATISNLASGKSTPRADMVAALQATLGIDVGWWLVAAPVSTPTLPSSDDATDTPDATGTEG